MTWFENCSGVGPEAGPKSKRAENRTFRHKFAGAAALVSAIAFAVPICAAEPPSAASHKSPSWTPHHILTVSIDPATHTVSVRDSVRVPLRETDGKTLRFLLHRDLQLLGVHCERGTAFYDPAANFDPRHFWEHPPYDELAGFELATERTVHLPSGDLPDTVSFVIKYGGIIADSLHTPEVAYGRSFETTSGRIVDQGAFLSGASFWVPWFRDQLVTFDLKASAPLEWATVSQGQLVGYEDTQVNTMRWLCEKPMEEIYLVSGPYMAKERTVGEGIKVMTFCYENTGPEITDRYLDGAEKYLDVYAKRFGPYPFEKFALVENYWQSGWGMPSFTLLGDQVIRLPFILDTSFGHEILHNWWGNGVFVREEGGNWCEGLTTYCADYFAKERESAQAADEYRKNTLLGYRDFAGTGGRDFPLVDFRERESAATQAVGYGKTMMVFHMLRRLVGDEMFDAGLRAFYRDHLFREADWGDLRESFESATGRDLQPWFAQWTEREGAPKFSLEEVDVKHQGKKSKVTGVLVQEGSPFDLEVPVRLATSKGVVQQPISTREPRTPFTFEVEGKLLELALDPTCETFRWLHEGEIAPTLSGVLGAEQTRYVLGADCNTEMAEALRGVLEEWGADSTAVLVPEQELPSGGDKFTGATWVLGDGPLARELKGLVHKDPAFSNVAGSLVFAGKGGGEEASKSGGAASTPKSGGATDGKGAAKRAGIAGPWAVFLPVNATDAGAIARKIPHYSKYSLLAFEGTKNVAKAQWAPGVSPLLLRWDEK